MQKNLSVCVYVCVYSLVHSHHCHQHMPSFLSREQFTPNKVARSLEKQQTGNKPVAATNPCKPATIKQWNVCHLLYTKWCTKL